MFKITNLKFIQFFLVLSLLTGCGFHLRGTFSIPPMLQILQILPYQPYDNFQRALRPLLKNNDVKVVDQNVAEHTKVASLTILSQAFSERTVAYGSNGLPNRAVLSLKISYQLIAPNGKSIASSKVVSVERELTLNPNFVLSTDNERTRLQGDLYRDAALQLVRQLSMIPLHEL
jgi:LPS-assembly lipoprotein